MSVAQGPGYTSQFVNQTPFTQCMNANQPQLMRMQHAAPTYAAVPFAQATPSIVHSQGKSDFEKLTDQISKLSELLIQQANQRPQYGGPGRNINRNVAPNGDQVCYHCGQLVHIKRRCQLWLSQQSQPQDSRVRGGVVGQQGLGNIPPRTSVASHINPHLSQTFSAQNNGIPAQRDTMQSQPLSTNQRTLALN